MRTTLLRTTFSLAALLCIPAFAQDPNAPNPGQPPAGDPPGRVARIAFLQGNVSLEPAGVDTFSQAEMNYPLTVGDRVYADLQALSELQTAGLVMRMGNGADVTLSSLTDQVAQIGLAQGSIRVATHDLLASDGSTGVVEIDTPNGSIVVQLAGDIRVDSYPQDDSTVITVSSGQVEITAPGIDQVLGANQSLKLAGANPVRAQFLQLLPPDTLDRFDSDRESMYQTAVSQDSQYVSPDMIGASDLQQYGDWAPAPEYGEVWYPRGVSAGWTPYSNGHWAWVAPWGWTWVEAEPWGFAPFHYGRWNNFGGRWGWIPGPPPPVWGRHVRPVYSPALVAFVGGPGFSLSIGLGGGGGVAAWFPLGPGEPYTPWYHASPVYVNRVNVTNIYSRNAAEVRSNYTNRTTNVYVNNVTNVTYINRPGATTAVREQDFAAGHSVARSQPLRLDSNARQQLTQAPILPHPLVTPAATIAAPQAPPRALPPQVARPVLEMRGSYTRPENPAPVTRPAPQQPAQPAPVQQNFPQQRPHQPAPTQPATVPHAEAPVTPVAPAPARNMPTQAATPVQSAPGQTAPGRNMPAQTPAPVQPAPARNMPAQPTPVQPAPAQTAPGRSLPAQPTAPIQPVAPQRAQPVPAETVIAPRPADQPRNLMNRTPPQPMQPSFQEQQKAIQQQDPGRPLGPRQVDNLRQGRPAGPPAQPEPVQHPAPGRPAPPPPARPAPKPPV